MGHESHVSRPRDAYMCQQSNPSLGQIMVRWSDGRPLEAARFGFRHYDDVIMGAMASQITSLTIVYSTVYSGADQSKHQSSASLAFVWGIHRGPVNSPHKWPVKPRSHMYCNLSATALRLKNSCNQCNHCAIKNCIFRLQINRRLVGDNYP